MNLVSFYSFLDRKVLLGDLSLHLFPVSGQLFPFHLGEALDGASQGIMILCITILALWGHYQVILDKTCRQAL